MSLLDSTSHVVQLLLALGGGVILFILAYVGNARALFIGIVVMIPFQPIDSKYGSINMAITYVVGIAMLLHRVRYKSGLNVHAPLIMPFALLLLAFAMSWVVAPKLFWPKYMQNLILMGSNIVLFYMSYSFFRKEKDLDVFFRALIVSNVLVIIYSIIQMVVGYGQFSVFGLSEFTILENREDQRLVGPFKAVGITAEYLVIQSTMLAHYMVQTGKIRRLGIVLLLLNMAILVGTGNRGGFISMLLALVMFLYFYRRYLGGKMVLLSGLGFVFMLTLASAVVINYTDFNVLYKRLLGTEVEGFTPDTRRGWVYVVDKIMDKPILGHGPRIVRPVEYNTPPRNWPDGYIRFYPHSLYLYILYTTGIIGFAAYIVWAVAYWRILCRTRKRLRINNGIGAGLPLLGMMVFIIFLVDQVKVEFLRYYLLDYQHYLAALFGMFASLKHVEFNSSLDNKDDHITSKV